MGTVGSELCTPFSSTARWDLGSPPCTVMWGYPPYRGIQSLILSHSSKDKTSDLMFFHTGQAWANGSRSQLAWIICSPLKEL